MAYETGTATGPNDLLDKLRVFAVAQGWTQNRDVAAGSGREVCLSKGTSFFNLRSYVNENVVCNGIGAAGRYGILLNGSDGFNSANAWDLQPGHPVRKTVDAGVQGHANLPLPLFFGPFPSYHLFAPNAECIYLEVEVTAGTYQRLGLGKLDLFSSSAPGGGRFFFATGGLHPATTITVNDWLGADVDNSSAALELVPFRAADYATNNTRLPGSFLRTQVGAFNGWAGSARNVANSQMSFACQGGGCHDKLLTVLAPSPRNGIAVLSPNVVSINIGDEYLQPVGTVPGLRYVNIDLYQPGDEFTFGADTWKVFPWYRKGGTLSANRGIAYLKD